jgi:hypothetical protein
MGNARIRRPQVLHFFVRSARSGDRKLHPTCQDTPDLCPSLYLFNQETDSRLLGASPIESSSKTTINSATPELLQLLQLLYLTNPQWLENGQ